MNNIRNFAIIAHIDHGKSTLADRLLELTGTVAKDKLLPQHLDRLGLERERGITIKMQPVRMEYHTRISADQRGLLYEDLTYKIRGAVFNVYNKLGPAFKESVYQNALEEELTKAALSFEKEKSIEITYEGKKVGTYRPDFIVDDKIILELKALPFVGKLEKKQIWQYLKGSPYRLAFLINFGSENLYLERIVYDYIRENPRVNKRESAYILNLIDTPGHADFTYEVSRALKAVEGVVLLVDAIKGVQAQTVFNFRQAANQGLVIIPAVNKIDLKEADVERAIEQAKTLFASNGIAIPHDTIFRVSAKTGQGVAELLEAIVRDVPPPAQANASEPFVSLIFDSLYDSFRGVLAYVRVFQGRVVAGATLELAAMSERFQVREVGIFTPDFKKIDALEAGEIGYVATGIKEAGMVHIGDTIRQEGAVALKGFTHPQSNVFASFYPLEEGEFDALKSSLEKLQLNDPAISFERTESPLLGRGFRIGFLGKLHMEIAAGRLDQEMETEIIVGTPSVAYKVNGTIITLPGEFPTHAKGEDVLEPWVFVRVFTPMRFMGGVMKLLQESHGIFKETSSLNADTLTIHFEMPLAEIVTQDFYDKLKSASQGFASAEYEHSECAAEAEYEQIRPEGERREDGVEGVAKPRTYGGAKEVYEMLDWRPSDKVRLDILIAGEEIDAFSKIVERDVVEEEGRKSVKKLKDVLPRAQFVISLQARIEGRVIAREDIPALKKAVTAPLYGGDWSRKKKLLVKQREGKKRLRQFGRVSIPKEVFLKMM